MNVIEISYNDLRKIVNDILPVKIEQRKKGIRPSTVIEIPTNIDGSNMLRVYGLDQLAKEIRTTTHEIAEPIIKEAEEGML